jgi:hypothetical protein
MMKFAFPLFFFVVTIAGCATQAPSDSAVKKAAELYAVQKFGFKQPKAEKVTKTLTGYEVIVWERPFGPGGFYFEYLSADLQLIGSEPGR